MESQVNFYKLIRFASFLNQILELAKKITKNTDQEQAKTAFKRLISESSQYYNDGAIPANESDANAHKVCSSVKDAKKYCPKRFAAMNKWFAHSKEVRAIKPPCLFCKLTFLKLALCSYRDLARSKTLWTLPKFKIVSLNRRTNYFS